MTNKRKTAFDRVFEVAINELKRAAKKLKTGKVGKPYLKKGDACFEFKYENSICIPFYQYYTVEIYVQINNKRARATAYLVDNTKFTGAKPYDDGHETDKLYWVKKLEKLPLAVENMKMKFSTEGADIEHELLLKRDDLHVCKELRLLGLDGSGFGEKELSFQMELIVFNYLKNSKLYISSPFTMKKNLEYMFMNEGKCDLGKKEPYIFKKFLKDKLYQEFKEENISVMMEKNFDSVDKRLLNFWKCKDCRGPIVFCLFILRTKIISVEITQIIYSLM